MSTQRTKRYFADRSISVMCLCLLAGCAQLTTAFGPSASELIWPPAPETPRIRLLYTLSQPEDISIRPGLFGRIVGAFRGPQARGIISPYGLTRDPEGRLYVIDNFYQAVHVFDPERNRYSRFPRQSLDEFKNPVGIALGTNGRIYISDSVAGRVHVFLDQGNQYFGSIGAEYLQRPTGLTVNHQTGELLVLDTIASKLLVFDERDFRFKRSVGGEDEAFENVPVFHYPTNITVGDDGRVYVTDSLNFRIQALTSELDLIRGFGAAGDSPGDFSRPKGIASDSDGHVYVIDALFDNVQIFDDQGALLLAFGGPGSEPGRFWLPNAIFIDREDRIYVSDSYNKRVQVFQYLKEEENTE